MGGDELTAAPRHQDASILTRLLGGAAHDALCKLVPARRDSEHVVDDEGAAPRRLVRPRIREHGGDAVERRLQRVLNKVDELSLGRCSAAGKRHLCLHEPVGQRVDSPLRPGVALFDGETEFEGLV